MDAAKKKKKRGVNWNPQDKFLLQQLVQQKIKVIENKNTDSNTNHQKLNAWKEIEMSFNKIAIAKRNTTQLKCQWNILKWNAKKEKRAHLIAENELKCRMELHELQMEYERKRSQRLDLEREYWENKLKLQELKMKTTLFFYDEFH